MAPYLIFPSERSPRQAGAALLLQAAPKSNLVLDFPLSEPLQGDFPRRLLSSRALLSHAPRLPLSLIFPPSSHVLRILDIERLTSLPMC